MKKSNSHTKNFPLSLLTILTTTSLSLLHTVHLHAQTIQFNPPSGNLTASADITWYYQSQVGGGTWHTIFRAKGTANQTSTTNASGLTNPFPGFTGIVGNQVPSVPGHTGDYSFNTLNVHLITSTLATVGNETFFISAASGSPLLAPGSVVDLGFRTRLREDQVALGLGNNTAADQFTSFNLTLNTTLSNFNGTPLANPGSPHVAILHWDSSNNPIPLLNTATSNFTATFGNFGHVHRNWGFSSPGNYTLVFNLQGIGGLYGGNSSVGQSTIHFNVVPEPTTGLLILSLLGIAALLRHRLTT